MQEQLSKLIEQKDQLQAKLASLQAEIQAIDSTKNYSKGLVDREGFPRADLDFGQVANYRNLKRTKAQLNNDHVVLMKQIQSHLANLHATYPDIDPEQQEIKPTPQSKNTQQLTQVPSKKQQPIAEPKIAHNIDYLTPFARITIVDSTSPAETAGLRVGDLVSQFAQVNIYTINYMKEIPKLVKEGMEIEVVVLRQGGEEGAKEVFRLKDGNLYTKMKLRLRPATWAGKGLLGCKIDPLH